MKCIPCTTGALLLAVCSALAIRAADSPLAAPKPAPTADGSAPPQENPRFKATLLVLEADWSKVATAKQIQQDLQAALKEVPMPDDQRKNLAASGPLILFASEQVHVYRPDDLNELLVWLDHHKLVKTRIECAFPDRAPDLTRADEPVLTADLDVLPMKLQLAARQPLVRRQVQWRWSFFRVRQDDEITGLRQGNEITELLMPTGTFSDPSEVTIYVHRQLVVSEDYADQTNLSRWLNDARFVWPLPRDRVAVVHAIGDRSGDTQRWRVNTREQGVEPVLVVRQATVSVPALEGRVDNSGAVRRAELTRTVGRVERVASKVPADRPIHVHAPKPFRAEALKVFSLQHVEATTAASIVSQLFGPDSLTVAVEARGNTLIARGDEARLAEVETLLLRMDEKPTGDAAPRSSPAEANPPADVESREVQYRELEKHTSATAAELQQLRTKQADSHPQVKALQDRLRQQVTAAFEARQRWQNAELDQLRARLAAIEQSLDARERIRDTIIDRRVEELLDPDLHWESGDSPVPQESSAVFP